MEAALALLPGGLRRQEVLRGHTPRQVGDADQDANLDLVKLRRQLLWVIYKLFLPFLQKTVLLSHLTVIQEEPDHSRKVSI